MKLTSNQQKAVNHQDGPMLVLAVPGAGKTTILLKRLERLEKFISPSKIISITFSKAQSMDMKSGINSKSRIMTIHALCYMLLRQKYSLENRSLRLLESEIELKRKIIAKLFMEYNECEITDEEYEAFLRCIGFMKNSLLNTDFLKTIKFPHIDKIYEGYEKFKKDNHYIDFDDMLTKTYEYLNEDQEWTKSIRKKFKYYQLDEAQDTSLLQFKIIETLIWPNNNIIIVADDDQSIYSFRAGNPDYLLNFKNIFNDGEIIVLNENFRSQRNIVNLCKCFISQNEKRYYKDIYTRQVATNKIILKSFILHERQYKFIRKNINPNSSTLILYRNNSSAVNLMNFFYKSHIPINVISSNIQLFNRTIINDLCDIIKFSQEIDNFELFKEIYPKLNTYIKKEWIENTENVPYGVDIFDYLIESFELDEFYQQRFHSIKRDLKHIKSLKFCSKIKYIYHYLGYKEYLERQKKFFNKFLFNHDVFFESLFYFSDGLKTSEDFFNKLIFFEEQLHTRNTTNLHISSIHASKGMEFDDVFLIDMVENEFPNLSADKLTNLTQKEKLEEERRIFYVAISRAKERLFITTVGKRNGVEVKSSPFFDFIVNHSHPLNKKK